MWPVYKVTRFQHQARRSPCLRRTSGLRSPRRRGRPTGASAAAFPPPPAPAGTQEFRLREPTPRGSIDSRFTPLSAPGRAVPATLQATPPLPANEERGPRRGGRSLGLAGSACGERQPAGRLLKWEPLSPGVRLLSALPAGWRVFSARALGSCVPFQALSHQFLVFSSSLFSLSLLRSSACRNKTPPRMVSSLASHISPRRPSTWARNPSNGPPRL